jgi:tetratricopeptide (TPR) repeat protein
MAAFCYVLRQQSGWIRDREREVAEARRMAQKTIQLGKDDAVALHRAGHALAYVVHEFDAGQSFIDRALSLNRNLASAWLSSSCLRLWIGEPDIVMVHSAHFKRMSPLDPQMPLAQSVNAFAHFFACQYDEACSQVELVLQENPDFHLRFGSGQQRMRWPGVLRGPSARWHGCVRSIPRCASPI